MTRFFTLFFSLMFSIIGYADNLNGEKTHSLFASFEQSFDDYLVAPMAKVLFFDLLFFTKDYNLPFIVVWLIFGAIFFTIKMRFINLRAFKHAIDVTRGKYDDPNNPGEISHFQALSSALSATIGLGNIAGVAVAVSMGGPGAIFWMIVAGFFGMTTKFTECTLGQIYRKVNKDGSILGGPMCYLSSGFKEGGMPKTGKTLAVIFAVMCIGGSFGGGNMFQANQSFLAISNAFPNLADLDWAFGIIMSLLVAMVILGGIKRIGKAASVIVPFMCVLYMSCGVWILVTNYALIPLAFSTIFNEAFTPQAGYGGFLGVLIMGFRRAAFSNEAGVGSAAIAHSAAATDKPIREGIVALLGPFIDTVVICTMTGLIIVITGVYTGQNGSGVQMTTAAFAKTLPWFPYALSFAVLLFAFSTMISWSYYGERCWSYLFGEKSSTVYKLIFVAFVFLGSVFSQSKVIEFSDLMILGMALPNIIGVIFLSGKVKDKLDVYWDDYKNSNINTGKESLSIKNCNKQGLQES